MIDPQWISIGKLAKATGLAVERIRMWELRYGAPQSEKLPSGHRRYGAAEVERLHLVTEALSRGKRPRHIVALKREALLQVLGTPPQGRFSGPAQGGKETNPLLAWTPKTWVAAAIRMDESFLNRQFYEHWLELGSLRFLVERAHLFIEALGSGWQKGEIRIAEEHFGSEKLGDFLSSIWRRLNEKNSSNRMLLSTLPGDTHRLGLQMVALVAALAGSKVIYLGPSTPLDEIIKAAGQQKVTAVLLSLSLGQDPKTAIEQLRWLRAGLPKDILIGVGGAGAPMSNNDFRRFQDLPDFYHWVYTLAKNQIENK